MISPMKVDIIYREGKNVISTIQSFFRDIILTEKRGNHLSATEKQLRLMEDAQKFQGKAVACRNGCFENGLT